LRERQDPAFEAEEVVIFGTMSWKAFVVWTIVRPAEWMRFLIIQGILLWRRLADGGSSVWVVGWTLTCWARTSPPPSPTFAYNRIGLYCMIWILITTNTSYFHLCIILLLLHLIVNKVKQKIQRSS
jgi:hypothetical protein